jgi:transketolase
MQASSATAQSSSVSPSDAIAQKAIACLAMDAVEKAANGHPGAPMGQAAIATELFAHHLVYCPEEPNWPNRDRFVLSCGHSSMLLYSVLHLAGYALSIDDLKSFRQRGSKTAGHPEHGYAPGIETTTGPLGQGVGNAVGMALAGKMAAARVPTPGVFDYRVYALCSDGDLMEGISYEAMSLAGHLCLDNLILIYDDNRITIDGSTDLAFGEDVLARAAAFGFHVQAVDGHDSVAVGQALEQARASGRPALIAARTHIGYGSPGKQDKSAAHGAPLGAAEIAATKTAWGWPLEPTFHVPDQAYEAFRPQRAKNRAAFDAWKKRVADLGFEENQALQALISREVPETLFRALLDAVKPSNEATRVLSSNLEQIVAAKCPWLIGGSADLQSSVKTTIKGSPFVSRGEFSGRNIHFGIREHGMGSILNGLALSGNFTPLGSTFLIFGDYMRPPMRLAALMEQQVIYVLTHDSVYLGEDGPTHQPVEQLWTMRMVPNLHVFRPADALECAAAWAYAMNRTEGPTVLALTRQDVPTLERPADFDPVSALSGAYILSDEMDPELVLMATGSEVSVAVEAKQLLRGKVRVRVVSMPCVQAFMAWSPEKQATLLPPGVRRASFEAGVTLPWRALTGLDGICIGVDRFGLSAPFEDIRSELGLGAEAVATRILSEMGR